VQVLLLTLLLVLVLMLMLMLVLALVLVLLQRLQMLLCGGATGPVSMVVHAVDSPLGAAVHHYRYLR